jgi:hypothetical protein
VVAGRQVIAGTAKVDSNTVAQILSVVRLRISIAAHADDIKKHGIAVASAVLVARWKVAVDAVNDVDAGRFDRDGFNHLHAAICIHGNAGVKRGDSFRLGRSRNGRHQYQETQPEDVFHGIQ